MKKLFGYTPLTEDEAPRGKVGIPRVLNMYENYPLWFTFFTQTGISGKCSPRFPPGRSTSWALNPSPASPSAILPSWPTAHISWLLKQGVKFIFYPCIPYERNEDPGAVNHYNCPIVTSYAENIKNNVDELNNPEIRFNESLPGSHQREDPGG